MRNDPYGLHDGPALRRSDWLSLTIACALILIVGGGLGYGGFWLFGVVCR
jgi:hypothetical protein